MKVRNGFVSNSSSSSFILKLDKVPATAEELRVILYGENSPIFTAYSGDDAVSTEQVSKIIFNDINSQNFFGVDGIIDKVKEEIGSFSKYSVDEGRDFVVGTEYLKEFDDLYAGIILEENKWATPGNRNGDWKEHYDNLGKLSEPMFEIVEKAIREKFSTEDTFIEVEYGDECAVFAYIEHSGILDKISIQRFSHH